MFNIKFGNRPLHILKKMDIKNSKKILDEIKKLSDDPTPFGAVKLKQFKDNVYRLKIWSFRVLYVINRKDNEIYIAKIDRRDDHTYDRL